MGVGVFVGLLGVASLGRAESLDREALMREARHNKALARYLKVNGLPDVAERLPIRDEPPWDDHQVVLDYLDLHREVSFARARVLGVPEIHTRRYQRVLTDADVARLRSAARLSGDSAPACEGECATHTDCPHRQAK
jgi:hypothetical protein